MVYQLGREYLTSVGIGGIAAALTLGLRGHHITILESAPKVCVHIRPTRIKGTNRL
jgi:hypothetical protein